jgi:hypothetical protein
MPPASATAVHNTTTSALTSGTSCWHNACGFTLIGCAYAVAAVLATREQNAYYASYALSRQDLYSDSIINLYADSMQILCYLCSFNAVSMHFCEGYIYIYDTIHAGLMQVLSRFNAGFIQVLCKLSADFLQILPSFMQVIYNSFNILCKAPKI